jgi:long-chain acyl-CoA synthetase
MLSHANIIADIKAIHTRLFFGPEDVFLSILPLHHTFECTCGFLTPMSMGCTIAFARSFKSSELLEDMRASNATVMCGVPLLFEKMYLVFKRKIGKSRALSRSLFRILFSISSYGLKRNSFWGESLFRSLRTKAGLDCLRLLVSGGAALPYEVAHFFNAIGINLVQGYGLSETSPVLSVNSIGDNRFNSIGPPLDGVEVRIDNPDPNGIGEIVIKGPMIMKGYYGNESATAAVLRQGWFFTGDVGHQDSEGYLYITGRSKNVIVSAAGKNIHPEEIEEHLNLSPYILESLVLGRKLPDSNVEDVTAVIVPDRDFIMQSDDLQNDNRSVEEIIKGEVWDICSRLADYKRVKRFFIRDEELPKTSSQKIKRCLDIDDAGNLFEKKRV